MPEVKIRKAVRALWARSALSSALLRSNLRDSHFQTGGIATDYMPQIYNFSIGYQQKKPRLQQKRHCLLAAKVTVFFYRRLLKHSKRENKRLLPAVLPIQHCEA
jgi:hypothetical protein